MLILMDEDYEALAIFEADREVIVAATEEGSEKRAKRGAMSVAKFKAIGTQVWSVEDADEENAADEQASL